MTKKIQILLICTLFMLLLSGCTYTGINDLPLFLENFNSKSGASLHAEAENLVIHPEEKEKIYYLFFPANNEGEYMVTLNENEEGEIYKCGICIISSIDVNTKTVKKLFVSELCALKDVSEASADSIFSELDLNNAKTYKSTVNVKKEMSDYTVELIVNDAGAGIYIY